MGQLDGVPGQAEDGAQRPDCDAGDEQGDRPVPAGLTVYYVVEDALADLELDVCGSRRRAGPAARGPRSS